MKNKLGIIKFALLFGMVFAGMTLIKGKLENRKVPVIETSTAVSEVSENLNDNSDDEDSPDKKELSRSEEKARKKERKEKAEDQILSLIEEGRIDRARKLYKDNKEYNLDPSLEDDMDAMETELVEEATDEAKSVYLEEHNIDKALSILEDCKNNVGNNKKLKDYIKLLESSNQQDITKLDIIDQGARAVKGGDLKKDVYGNVYDKSLIMRTDHYAFGGKGGVYSVYYIRDLGVNTLNATIAPTDSLSTGYGTDFHISIWGMDENQEKTLLYKSDPIKETSLPKTIEVEIPSEYPFLAIGNTKGSDISGPDGTVLLGNPILYNKITAEDFEEIDMEL